MSKWRPSRAHRDPDVLRDFQRVGQALPRRKTLAVQGATWSTTSASLVDWGGSAHLQTTFVKGVDSTLLVVRLDLSFYLSTVTTVAIGVKVDSTDLFVQTFANETTSHKFRSAPFTFTGLAEGTHTITARIAVGAGTLSTDTADYGALDVMEILAE